MWIDAEGIPHWSVVGEHRLIRSKGQEIPFAIRCGASKRNLTDAGESGVGRPRIKAAAVGQMTHEHVLRERIIEDAVARPDDCLAFPIYVPGHAETRGPVVVIRLVQAARAHGRNNHRWWDRHW